MSQNDNIHSAVLTEHIRKKLKKDNDPCQMIDSRQPLREINPSIFGSSQVFSLHEKSVSDPIQLSSSIDRYEQIFAHYSNDQQTMFRDEILRFCNDLSIELNSYEILLFCFLCRAKQMYLLTKNEFLLGLKTLGDRIDNLFVLRTLLVNYPISSNEQDFYKWIYHIGIIEGQRHLTTQNALILWRLFYSKKINKPKILDQWLAYLENNIDKTIPSVITYDSWTIFPRFAQFIQLNGYDLYDENDAWPCLFDRFVDYCRKQLSKPKVKQLILKAFPIEIDPTTTNGEQHPISNNVNSISRPNSSSSSNYHDFSTGKLRLSDTKSYKFTSKDLIDCGVIGEGSFGLVCKMKHEKSGTVMAVKRIRSTVDERCQKQMLFELDIVMRDNTCPNIIQFYGALFEEGDCLICMELLDTSLDHFYKFVYHKLDQFIPESVLAYITLSTLEALDYIKSRWNIIHRDVKPSNILVSRTAIKLCDFGISGQLVDSIAKTRDAGYRPYLPPERIDPSRATSDGYDVRSDVWSLGITIYEIATGYFPFREWKSVFDQLQQIVEGPQLKLSIDRLSDNCTNFVNTCLDKDENQRPKYKQLLSHPFVQGAKETQQTENALVYLSDIIDGIETSTDTFKLCYYLPTNSR